MAGRLMASARAAIREASSSRFMVSPPWGGEGALVPASMEAVYPRDAGRPPGRRALPNLFIFPRGVTANADTARRRCRHVASRRSGCRSRKGSAEVGVEHPDGLLLLADIVAGLGGGALVVGIGGQGEDVPLQLDQGLEALQGAAHAGLAVADVLLLGDARHGHVVAVGVHRLVAQGQDEIGR